MALNDYDALLVLSFGGPEGEDEVIPFLENVTRGRGIPRERLAEVGEHYFHFGGVSPINQQNREIIANIEKELAARGHDLPVYFGNRNWHPMAEDTAKEIQAAGHKRVLVFANFRAGVATPRGSAFLRGIPDLLDLKQAPAGHGVAPTPK